MIGHRARDLRARCAATHCVAQRPIGASVIGCARERPVIESRRRRRAGTGVRMLVVDPRVIDAAARARTLLADPRVIDAAARARMLVVGHPPSALPVLARDADQRPVAQNAVAPRAFEHAEASAGLLGMPRRCGGHGTPEMLHRDRHANRTLQLLRAVSCAGSEHSCPAERPWW
jgi:hypothetical protein